MRPAATFLAGAKSRLLPASIPFRFFAAAAVFHPLAWLALLAGAEEATGFRGGPGPTLAAIHLLTLGVLTTTAIGASVQLLPVATRRALAAVWPIRLMFWLVVPGIALLGGGMYVAHVDAMIAGALVTGAGLLLFAALLADNLRRAGSLKVVAAYGSAALVALVALAGLGIALSYDYRAGFLSDHISVALAHLVLGGFGFMGMLALGFSHILVPMFALSAAPPERWAFGGFLLAILAVALGTVGALVDSLVVMTAAAFMGLLAAAVHLWLMRWVLANGMRKRLGLSFVLIRAAWALLALSPIVGLSALYGLAGRNGATLFGFLLLAGWLLTFLLGVLQRILPFLASMHATRTAGRGPPLLSELASSAPLKLHAICHGLALAIVTVAIVLDAAWLVRVGGAIGFIGAAAFAWFTADVTRRAVNSGAT